MNLLTDAQQNVLARIIERGVDMSTDRLAQVTQTRWKMSTLSLSSSSGEKIRTLVGNSPVLHRAAYFHCSGLALVSMFPLESSHLVARAFVQRSGEVAKALADLERIATSEISNILANAVISAMADVLEERILLSPPQPLEGPKSHVIQETIRLASAQRSYAMMSYVSMSSFDLAADCVIILFLDENLLRRLIPVLDNLIQ